MLSLFPSQAEVLCFTEEIRSEGYSVVGEPRTSGDGYFESVVLDPDGNRIECVYKKESGEETKTGEKAETNETITHTLETGRLVIRPFQEMMQKHFSLVVRILILGIMPDGHPIKQ